MYGCKLNLGEGENKTAYNLYNVCVTVLKASRMDPQERQTRDSDSSCCTPLLSSPETHTQPHKYELTSPAQHLATMFTII